MSLLPIRLPPGLFHNGTKYNAKGRWYTANLVRWYAGAMRAVGGWSRVKKPDGTNTPNLFTSGVPEVCRDAYSWQDNTFTGWGVFGTNVAVKLLKSDGTLANITPIGFTAGAVDPDVLTGYGIGPFGYGPYGTPRVIVGDTFQTVGRWTFDSWGEDLLATFGTSGSIYAYSIANGGRLTVIADAPAHVADFVVTPERFVMAVGSQTDKALVQWSDREDYGDWDFSDATKEAGFLSLEDDGALVSIGIVQNRVLILGNSAFVANYIGPPYVYGFEQVAKNCPPVHNKAVIHTGEFAIWLGRRNFWLYSGGSVQPMDCDVMDWLQSTMNYDFASTISTVVNSRYSEVTWFFRSKNAIAAGDDNDAYLTWNYKDKHWTFGYIYRTAGFDSEPFRYPIYVDRDGRLWNHEQESIRVLDAYAETGPIELGEGDRNVVLRAVYPDTDKIDSAKLTFYGSQMPTDPEYTYGPYGYTNPTPTRVKARQIRMRVDNLRIGFKLGVMRFDVTPGGKR